VWRKRATQRAAAVAHTPDIAHNYIFIYTLINNMKLGSLAVLPVLFIVQKIDFTNPEYLLLLQVIFSVVQGSILLLCAYIYNQINTKNDRTIITVPPSSSPFGGASTEPAKQTSIRDYDISQLRKVAQQIGIGIGIAILLYFKWSIIPPMAIQCVLNPMNVFNSPLFKIYILGSPQPRPFPDDNPLAGLMQQPAQTQAPPPAAIDTNEVQEGEKKKKSKKKD